MNRSFQDRLSHAPINFLLAIKHTPPALADFYKDWSQLRKDVTSSHAAGHLTDDTLHLAGTVAAEMEALAEAFLCLEIDGERLTEEVVSELKSALPCPHPINKSLSFVASGWLVAHLEDPYPSKADKASIAAHATTTVKAVDNWFANTRKSIGWTTLSQSFFSGSRTATTAAARKVYVDGQIPSDISHEVIYAFLTVKLNAEKLYSRDLENSGAAVYEPVDPRCGESVYIPFPTESTSPSLPLFPVPIDDDTDEEEDTTPPPPVAGHKRRTIDEGESFAVEHANFKRPRLQRTVSVPSSRCKAITSSGAKRRHISSATSTLPIFYAPPTSLLPSLPQQFLDANAYIAMSPGIVPSTVSTTFSSHPSSVLSKRRVECEEEAAEPNRKRLRPLSTTNTESCDSSDILPGALDTGVPSSGGAFPTLELPPLDDAMFLDMTFFKNWSPMASEGITCNDNILTETPSDVLPMPSLTSAETEVMARNSVDPWSPLPFLSPSQSVSSLGASVSGDESLWESSDGDAFSCTVGWDFFEDFIRSLTPNSEVSSALPSPQLSATLFKEAPPSHVVAERDIWKEFCVGF